MRHARPDYERFQDPEQAIPEDEPVFLIRGQDLAAPSTLRHYAHIAQSYGASADLVDRVNAHAEAMERWQVEHKAKVPDV